VATKKEVSTCQMEHTLATKEIGGLGIHDIEIKNIALLSKWLFKLFTLDGT